MEDHQEEADIGQQGQEHHREHSLRGFQHFLIVCSDVLLLQMCIVQRGAGLVVVAAVVPIILCSRFIYLNIGAALARPTLGADKNCTFFQSISQPKMHSFKKYLYERIRSACSVIHGTFSM